jgi:phosphoenolpyruvate carboxylase
MSTDSDRPERQNQADSIGYRKPPVSTRFRPGVSGNPRGRPKGTLNVTTVLIKTVREKVVINEGGQRKSVTKLEAALKQLVNKAASGELRALRQLLELAQDAESRQDSAAQRTSEPNDLDLEVMDGILKRFQSTEEPTQHPEEDVPDGDQRS